MSSKKKIFLITLLLMLNFFIKGQVSSAETGRCASIFENLCGDADQDMCGVLSSSCDWNTTFSLCFGKETAFCNNRTTPLGCGAFSSICVWKGPAAPSTTHFAPALPIQTGCTIDPATNQEVCKLDNPLANDKTEATQIIATVIKTALGIIGALTLLMLVWGGFQWLTSAGNPEKVKMGTQTMVWAVIGVLLVFASYMLLSTFLGFLASPK